MDDRVISGLAAPESAQFDLIGNFVSAKLH
jgi:hypothetical protein